MHLARGKGLLLGDRNDRRARRIRPCSGHQQPRHRRQQLACACKRTLLEAQAQGLSTGIVNPSKCRRFRVAKVARCACAMPAIWVSRISTIRPVRCRSEAKVAACTAASLSNGRTRFSRSSSSTRAKADSSARRRRPSGNSARPRRLSNKVMLVIQVDWGACKFNHCRTAGSSPGASRQTARRCRE